MYLRLGELWQFNHFIKLMEADGKLFKISSICPSSMANAPFVYFFQPPLLKKFFIQYHPNEIRDKYKNKPIKEVVCSLLEDYKTIMHFFISNIFMYIKRLRFDLK